MAQSKYPQAQNPLILRATRLIEAFAKSNDERDFFLDRVEGFIVYVDVDKTQETLDTLENELNTNSDRYSLIPKMSFYESKKIMESFVHEKVYDIDTKEKLLDLIQAKEARENFLEFIYEQHTELEKWQQFYQERSRIRIIEWLRNNNFHFVFEEDLDLGIKVIEKLKEQLFDDKVGKDIALARKSLFTKAKTYYSNEALNPRPKRGRPPKQQVKKEDDRIASNDIYVTVPSTVRSFLFTPDLQGISAATFSAKYESEEELLRGRGIVGVSSDDAEVGDLQRKLAAIRNLSAKWVEPENDLSQSFDLGDDDEDEEDEEEAFVSKPVKAVERKANSAKVESKELKKKAVVEKESSKADVPKKKPLRSIIKKPVEVKAASAAPKATKANGTAVKKRIIPKDAEKPEGRKHLRKIIPAETSKKK